MSSIEEFKYYLLQGGRKPQTVVTYIDCFKRLQKAVPSLTVSDIQLHLMQLKEQGRKSTYLNAFIDTLRLYGRCSGVATYDSLTYFKEVAFVKATMSDSEIEAFLALEAPTVTRYQWKAKKHITYQFDKKGWQIKTLFWKICAYSGMRMGEVAGLTIESCDIGRQVFVLEDTKTNTSRYVPIAQTLLHDLVSYIKTLKGNYLFSKNGKVYDNVDWGYDFHQRLKRLGIRRKNLTPYSMRHSFITRMIPETDLFSVQRIVGHRQISTTAGYVHLDTKQLISSIKKDPLGRKQLTVNERIMQGRKALEDLGFTVLESQEIDNKIRYTVIDE